MAPLARPSFPSCDEAGREPTPAVEALGILLQIVADRRGIGIAGGNSGSSQVDVRRHVVRPFAGEARELIV